MAQETETLLFEVILDIPQVKEKAELARVAIAQLRKEKAATEKEFKEKSIGAEEYAKSMQAIDTQLTRAQGQLKGYQKTLADNDKATKSAAGSNDQLRAQLSLIVPQLNAMGKAQRQNSVEGKYFEDQVRRLNAELKENEEAVGDHRRSVGDYAKGLRVAGISLGEVQEAVKGGVEAFQVFTKGITVTRGALIALSAIPILLLLTGLVALLTKSQAGMDKLAQYTKAFDLALSSLTQGFVKIGLATAAFFSAETFSFWDKMKEKAIALKDAYFGVADGVAAAAKAGIDIEKTNQRIEDSEIKLNVVRAKSRAEVERLKLLAEDTSKSTTVRAAAAKKAFEIENNLMKQQSTLQKERIANAEREYELSGKTRDDARKVAEERVRLAEIEEDSLGKQTELNNNLNSIRTEGITKAKEAAALAAQEEISHYERMIVLAKQKGEDTLLLEEALIKKKGAAEALETKKGSEKRKLIEVQTNAEILALRVAHAQTMWENISAIQRAQLSAARASALAGSVELENLELREAARQTEDKRKQIKADYDTQKITKERYEAELADIERNADLDKQSTRNRFAADRINKEAELGKLFIQIEQNTNEDFITTRRNQAVTLINIEERQQLDLLALQELGRKERETKEAAIVAEAEARRKEVYRQIQADERADRKAMQEIQLAESKKGSSKEIEAQKQLLRLQRDEELANTELTEKQKAAIRAKYRREETDLEKARFDEQVDKAVLRTNQSIAILSNIFQAQANVQTQFIEEQENAALASVGLSAEAREKIAERFDAKREAAEKKAAEQRRKIALAEAVVNTAGAVIKASPNVFLMALAGLTGLAQIAIIESQKFAKGGVIEETKLAKGGVIIGPSHAQGGVKYRVGGRNVELEGGEGVINKHAMRVPGVRQKASELNQMAGNGVAFAGTSPTRHYSLTRLEYGGIIQTIDKGSAPSIDYGQLRKVFIDAVSSLPPQYVRVGDIRSGVGRQISVENRAEISI